jgi:hypothetical protein
VVVPWGLSRISPFPAAHPAPKPLACAGLPCNRRESELSLGGELSVKRENYPSEIQVKGRRNDLSRVPKR